MASKKDPDMYVAIKELNAKGVEGHMNTSKEQIKQLYDKFAQDYEKSCEDKGYVAHRIATDVFHKSLGPGKENIRILDVGCGTGFVGEHLRDFGYTNVDALDMSQDMLDIAIKKGVYKKTYCDFFDKDHKLPILDGEYDALVCVGTIAPNHVKADAFDEIIRLVKAGGIICFTIRYDAHTQPEFGYIGKFSELVKNKKWELISEELGQYHVTVGNEPFTKCAVVVYKIM